MKIIKIGNYDDEIVDDDNEEDNEEFNNSNATQLLHVASTSNKGNPHYD